MQLGRDRAVERRQCRCGRGNCRQRRDGWSARGQRRRHSDGGHERQRGSGRDRGHERQRGSGRDRGTSGTGGTGGTPGTDGSTDARDSAADGDAKTLESAAPDAGDLVFDEEFDALNWYDSATKKGTWAPTGLDKPTKEGMDGWGSEFDINPKTTTTGVNPFSITDGVLTITTDVASASVQTLIGGRKYTSGALRTMNVTLGNGYYEMRAQLPAGNGNWPAFWLLPADGSWPPEIDIVEGLANAPTKIYCTVHSTVAFPGNTYQPGANHWAAGYTIDTADTQTGFHTYGVDFGPAQIAWYFDGAKVASIATPSDLVNRAVYIVLDNALGGWNGNAVDATTKFPAFFRIDYVRVYRAKP